MDPVGCQTEKAQPWLETSYCSPASLAFKQQRHAAALSLHANMSHYDLFEPQLLREIIQLVTHEFMNPWPLGCHIEPMAHRNDMWCIYGPADNWGNPRISDDRKATLKQTCVLRGTLAQQPISSCRRHQLYFVATADFGTETQKEKSFTDVSIQFSGNYSIYADLIVKQPHYKLILERYHPHGKPSDASSGKPSEHSLVGDFFVVSSTFGPSLHLQISWEGWLIKGETIRILAVDLPNTQVTEFQPNYISDFEAGVWYIAHHCKVEFVRLMYEADACLMEEVD